MTADELTITQVLAIWGAFTGTVAWGIGIYNFVLDRPRLRIRMSRVLEDEIRVMTERFVAGSGRLCEIVEICNAGRRKVAIYEPELWVRNGVGLLDTEAPCSVLSGTEWVQAPAAWTLHALSEGDTVTFLFTTEKDDQILRVDVADTLARFTHRYSWFGRTRWWVARIRGGKNWREWRNWKHTFFRRGRPRHHKDA